jgi:hypothetical protein
MRTIAGKVVKGKVVTRAKLPEGAKLTVFVHEADEEIELDADDEAAIGVAMKEIRADRYMTGAELRAFLRRPRGRARFEIRVAPQRDGGDRGQ